ncbi:hypothetical protein B7463_g7826, partial [Scytalidium lignicola]
MSVSQLPHDAVWFVTGCSSGVGRSIASLIAKKPSLRVVATARNVSSLDYLPRSPNVLKLALDVTSRKQISVAIDSTLAKFGRVDVFVNNAGYYLFGDTECIQEQAARKQMDTNSFGAADITLEALRVFREVNSQNGGTKGGLVLQISSSSGFVGLTGSAYYNASKFAIEGFTEGLSKEVNPDWNIRFLIIEPGGMRSQFVANIDGIARHPAYTDLSCPTNQLRVFLDTPEMKAGFAHPDRVAEIVFEASGMSGLPLRLPVGGDAWGMIKRKVDKMQTELEKVKILSQNT